MPRRRPAGICGAFVIPRRREIAVEYFLLFRIKNRANPVPRGHEQFPALYPHLAALVFGLAASVGHDRENLIALDGREVQLAVHPLDEMSTRHVKKSISIGERARGKAD